jgi:hypothetical protein
MQTDLSDWIKCHLRRVIKEQGSAAQAMLEQCGIPVTELKSEWSHQCQSQLSIYAHK